MISCNPVRRILLCCYDWERFCKKNRIIEQPQIEQENQQLQNECSTGRILPTSSGVFGSSNKIVWWKTSLLSTKNTYEELQNTRLQLQLVETTNNLILPIIEQPQIEQANQQLQNECSTGRILPTSSGVFGSSNKIVWWKTSLLSTKNTYEELQNTRLQLQLVETTNNLILPLQ
jgi:uracil DNA glycosylase